MQAIQSTKTHKKQNKKIKDAKKYTQKRLPNTKPPEADNISKTQKRKARRKNKGARSIQEVRQRHRRQQQRQNHNLYQSSMAGAVRDDGDEYFDRISNKPKAKNTLRYVHHNISNLPITALGSPDQPDNKNHQFCAELNTLDADILGFCEHGLNFSKLPAEDQWKERCIS